jgi:hypothetical protein
MDDPATPGYLGLRERQIDVDWTLAGRYGPCVLVNPRSPAAKAGLRFGDYITSINGASFDEFHKAVPPVGTRFEIVAWREGLDVFHVFGILAKPPKEREKQPWEKWPATIPGRPVRKAEHPYFFHGFISKDPRLTPPDCRYLSLLANYRGRDGIFPKRRTIASNLHCSLSTVARCQQRCTYRGVLTVMSGKRRRSSNEYVLTLPADHERAVEKADPATDPLKVSDAAKLLAEEFVKLCRLDHVAEALRGAPRIVEEWLERGWDPAIIRRVIRDELKHRAPSQSLRYFEKALAKAHGA